MEAGAARKHSFLPEIGALMMPRGTAFQPVWMRYKLREIERFPFANFHAACNGMRPSVLSDMQQR